MVEEDVVFAVRKDFDILVFGDGGGNAAGGGVGVYEIGLGAKRCMGGSEMRGWDGEFRRKREGDGLLVDDEGGTVGRFASKGTVFVCW